MIRESLPQKLLQKQFWIIIGVTLLLISCGGGGGGGGGGGSTSSCDCPNVSGSDTAADGSTAVLSSNTCMDPSPCSDANDLSVSSYNTASLTSNQQSELNQIGTVYALLEIEPDGKTWDPAIQITVALLTPAPRDNFTLTIYRWAGSSWEDEGTAIADRLGDMEAHGEITHTSLYAFVDTTTPGGSSTVVIPDVIGLPIEQAAEIFAEVGLEIGQIEEFETEAEPGTVIDTDPGVGSEVEPGTAVNLFIAQPPPPVANFTQEGDAGGCFFAVQFVNLSENADAFLWDFGDGQQSEEVNPVHEYDVGSEGSYAYTVVLTAFGLGGVDEIVREDYISGTCIQ